MHKDFHERKKKKLATGPDKKMTKKTTQKNIANSLHSTAKSPSEYMRDYRAWKKTLQNTLLMLSLKNGNTIEILLLTAHINTDLGIHSVPLTTEPSTSLVRRETDACKSIINSILRYKDYYSHKNAHKDF
ncbi:uncharacterized protein TNCV_1038411 [Trichonephila clavipes]|uniref:Uncharacterized protein n=1 Tax=Trichonephila clavipes TaxID=2585209 RepID=A0A8X6VVY1_TRICX|nr:uncharacterized protein TNCV_1038411 [Trichonephila clavipes]